MLALAIAAPAGGAWAQVPAPVPRCSIEIIGTATAKAAIDGRTLVLADGRMVRLAGIETPAAGPAATAAKVAVDTLLAGRDIVLKGVAGARDRHGHVLAYAFAAGDERSAQQLLLAMGHARVAAWVGDAGCAGDLLRAEQIARAAHLGVWSDSHYFIRGTENPAAVLAERGRFTLVEGPVLSVRESGGVIYVNFGRRWSEDFTVTIAKRSEKIFTSAGLEPKKLSGRRVRVRGVIEERGGPWIEAARPEQIEVIERN